MSDNVNIPEGLTLLKQDDLLISKLGNMESIINKPEFQNYAANQMQKQLSNMVKVPDYSNFKNPHEETNSLLSENNQLLQDQNDKIESLKSQLDYSNIQLKQANDKIATQTGQIKELKANLSEESLKRELAESKLSLKDWKLAAISFASGVIATIIGTVILNFII